MADKFTSTTKGKDRVMQRIAAVRAVPDLSAIVSAGPSSGRLKRKRTADKMETRTAGQNITIMRTHAKGAARLAKRNISDMGEGDMNDMLRMWSRALGAFMKTLRPDALQTTAGKVAQSMVRAMRSRVESGHHIPVKLGTQKQKDREGLRVGLPAMIRSGQLIRSLFGWWSQR